MSEDLANRHCKPCAGGEQPLDGDQIGVLLQALHPDWSASEDSLEISRTFKFTDYDRTMDFTNAVASIAMAADHHPVLVVSYGTCEVSYTTHAINGLSDNDFICAAKIDRLISDTAE